jgi:proline dehydrogenase
MLELDFSNTERAYRYLDNYGIMRAHMIFSAMDHSLLSKWGPRVLQWAFQYKLPLSPIVRRTLFAHFCGGETLDSCKPLIEKLNHFHVGVVLDYAVESSTDESSREKGCIELLTALDTLKSMGQRFAVFKPTCIMSSKVLEKLGSATQLSEPEKRDYEQGRKRARRILVKAKELGLCVLVDAEESWFQNAIDTWVLELMREFNKEKIVLYQTIQMYRTDRLAYLTQLIATAEKEEFFVGMKLVRGAYMEKENERAQSLSYPSPIHANKEACDKDFNAAMDLCMLHLERVSLFLGSHNEDSTLRLARKIAENSTLSPQDPRLVFSQLYGMSDALTFNLAEAGFNTVKYVPYGPVITAIPYLIRRSQENSSVQGQMGRELFMIKKEIQRRKLEH